MDTNAARRARQKAIKADLAEVYDDDEASPPEWVDILSRLEEAKPQLEETIARETERFVRDPDVRAALGRREHVADEVRKKIDELNLKIRRLNLIAPHTRFTRPILEADAVLRPLYRSERQPGSRPTTADPCGGSS